MAQIAVTLSASIAESAIAANGETTISLLALPGNVADVITAEALYDISCTADSDLVTVTGDGNGIFTVAANGELGETKVTLSAKLYHYDFSSKEYTSDTDVDCEITFGLTITEAEETPGTATDPEENPSAESSGSGGGGCNAGTGALALLALIPLALRRRKSK